MLFFRLPNTDAPLTVVLLLEAFLDNIHLAPCNTLMSRLLTPSKRVASLGVMNLLKMAVNGFGSFLTGELADRDLFWLVYVITGTLKLIYVDAMLYTFLAIDRRMTAELDARDDEDE